MADRNLSLGVEVDSSVDKAKRRLQELEKSQLELAKSFKRGDTDANTFAKGLSDIEREAKSLNKVLDALEQPRQIDVKTENFDKVSKDVGLAGDLQSNLGAASALVGGQGGQAISGVGEVFALIEELPRLRVALAGLPETIASAVTALGPVGVGLAAIGAVAVVVANQLNDLQQKVIDSNQRARDSFTDLTRSIVDGSLTTEEVNTRLDELNKKREAEQRILDAQKAEYQNYIDSLGALAGGVQAVSSVEEDRYVAIEETKKRIKELEQDEVGLKAARDSGALAANDAAQAERELAQERLSDAALAGELARLQAESASLSQEEIAQRQQQLELQRIQLDAELKALQSQDDLTQSELDRIAQIENALDSLSQKNDVLESAKATAQSEKDVKDARQDTVKVNDEARQAEKAKNDETKKSEQRAKELEQAQKQAQQAQDKYTQSLSDAKTKLSQAFQDIQTDLARNQADNQTDLTRQLTDINTQFNRDELSRTRQHDRDLKRLRESADDAEKSALRTRNFLQLADARKEAKDAEEQAQEEFKNEGQDRLIEAQNQRLDSVEEARRTTNDLRLEARRQEQDARLQRDRSVMAAREQLNITEQTLRQSVGLFQQWGQSILNIQQQILANRQGVSRYDTSSPTTQDNSSSIFEQARYGANL